MWVLELTAAFVRSSSCRVSWEETSNTLAFFFAGVLKDLVQLQDEERLSGLADVALQLASELPALSCRTKEQRATAMQLQSSGFALWNKTVTLKAAENFSVFLNAQRTLGCMQHTHTHTHTHAHTQCAT